MPATAPLKIFSLTRSINQQENRVGHNIPSPFRPVRADGHAGAQPIFPGLRRMQNTTSTNVNRPPQQQKPFFSLLNATANSAKAASLQRQEIMKHEPPSSDKGLSPSPPPSERAHISSIGLGIGINLPRPHQMLPPPIPPQGPDSRPPSPAPRPRPRSRSRSRSSTFCRGDEGEGEDDTSSLGMGVDVDVVVINALRGVRVANAELGEERRRSKSLLAQLNALTLTNESLKHEHSSVSEKLRSALNELAKRDEEACLLREERDQAIRKRGEEKEKIDALRRGMCELGESHVLLKTVYHDIKESYEREKKHKEEVQNAKAWAEENLKKLEPLLQDDMYLAKEARGLVVSLREELADSRRVIDLLRDKLHHLSSTLAETQNHVRELEDARRESREQLKSFLEKVEKGAEERVEVAKKRMEEMEGEFKTLRECRDVKLAQDLRLEHLAEKLHELEEAHNTTIVALDAARSECTELGRVKDGLIRSLAEAEEKRRSEAAANEKGLDVAKKAAEEAQDSRRQTEVQIALLQERFDAQTMTLRLTKEQHGDIQERFQASEDMLSKTRETLGTVRAELDAERAEVLRIAGEALRRTEELRDSDARLAELKEKFAVLNEGEKRAGDLEEALSSLRSKTLEQAQSRCIDLEMKMREALKELAEQLDAREMVLQQSLKEKMDEIKMLKKSERSKEDELHKAEVKVAASEAQEMVFRQNLAQKTDEIEVLKKDGKMTEDELRKAEVKIMALQEQLKSQEAVLKQIQGRYGDLQVGITGSSLSAECFVEGNEKKASARLAEDLTAAQNALEEARREVLQHAQDSMRFVELCERIEAGQRRTEEQRLSRAKEEGERVRAEDERVNELISVIERLEGEKRALAEKKGTLRERYDQNELNDNEKDFAEWLMNLARSLHEEEEVVKDNELRRKENLVLQLQVKIRELESSLAHIIKEKEELSGGTTKSMIDLTAFMTSSPSTCPTEVGRPAHEQAMLVNIDTGLVQPLPAKAIATKPLTEPAPAPLTKQTFASDKISKTPALKKTIGLSFSSLDESDSEEDIPLSEASAAAKTMLGKRDRVPSPFQPQDEDQKTIQSAMESSLETYTGSNRLVDVFFFFQYFVYIEFVSSTNTSYLSFVSEERGC
ncbi:hypothetical protein H2248_011152 [Termitomyces sp. 'cryptogamus']|nr:hypothetical protein H2248_011152 [Termitomyces sp. 'cryptogamus']